MQCMVALFALCVSYTWTRALVCRPGDVGFVNLKLLRMPSLLQVDAISAKVDTAIMAAEDRLPAVGGLAVRRDVDYRRRRVPVSGACCQLVTLREAAYFCCRFVYGERTGAGGRYCFVFALVAMCCKYIYIYMRVV